MGTGRQYDEKFKLEAVKLAREVGMKHSHFVGQYGIMQIY